MASGILAQLGEHLPYKQRVTGSSPVGPIKSKDLNTDGEVAQLARACGSYPQCRGFKSLLRYFSSLARWSSGQDATLSRSNQGFDSLTGQLLSDN